MTEYQKEVYKEYLKTIPVDIPLDRDKDGMYVLPPPAEVFNIT